MAHLGEEHVKCFSGLDGPIRANRFARIDWQILADRFRVPELNPFERIGLRGAKTCESQV